MKHKKTVLVVVSVFFLAACAAGPKIALDPESEKFYDTARLIMSKEENRIFLRLPDAESRREFIEDFWAKRDPDPYTPANEFKTAFFRRIEYANKHFREGGPGWKTDRGRIFIYLGPPDKFEEFFTHDDPDVRGPILWWFYYDYHLGIEFVDENGVGRFQLRKYDGNFFEALDGLMLGGVAWTEEGVGKKFADFRLVLDREQKAFLVFLPAKAFNFKREGGLLRADLEFEFFIYQKDGRKTDRFRLDKSFSGPEKDFTGEREVVFSIPYDLKPGEYYVDVVIVGKEASFNKTRKIFEIKT